MPSADSSILILGCFDTKGEVFSFLRNCILSQGEQVISVNTGVMGTTTLFPVDFESDEVAMEGGEAIDELRRKADRGYAVDIMGKGAAKIIAQLIAKNLIKGAIGMGGGGGTFITLSAMQHIPVAIPKLCLSTIAAKDLSRQMGINNITLMPSVVDVAGLNSISKLLIEQAAQAICAMAKVTPKDVTDRKGSIAISMFGNTTACVDKCTDLLNKEGYEVLAFHATGIGGKTMEALISEGYFDAVLDITTTELADELCGGVLSAGSERLTAASTQGIPQVVVPGCLDMVNFSHMDTVPDQYKSRQLYSWAPDVTLMRTNAAENQKLGESMASKLNPSKAAVAVVLPLKGLSQIDAVGGIFHHPEVNQLLFDTIKKHVNPDIQVYEIDANINEQKFAAFCVDTLLRLMQSS